MGFLSNLAAKNEYKRGRDLYLTEIRRLQNVVGGSVSPEEALHFHRNAWKKMIHAMTPRAWRGSGYTPPQFRASDAENEQFLVALDLLGVDPADVRTVLESERQRAALMAEYKSQRNSQGNVQSVGSGPAPFTLEENERPVGVGNSELVPLLETQPGGESIFVLTDQAIRVATEENRFEFLLNSVKEYWVQPDYWFSWEDESKSGAVLIIQLDPTGGGYMIAVRPEADSTVESLIAGLPAEARRSES